MSIEAILWPLGIGICAGALLLLAGLLLWVAIFIVAQPFCAAIGIRRAIRRYREEKIQPPLDSALSRARSE